MGRLAKTIPLSGSMEMVSSGSRSTPSPLILNMWLFPDMLLNIWEHKQDCELSLVGKRMVSSDSCKVCNHTCTCEIFLGYGPGCSSSSSMVDRTHLRLVRTKAFCWPQSSFFYLVMQIATVYLLHLNVFARMWIGTCLFCMLTEAIVRLHQGC